MPEANSYKYNEMSNKVIRSNHRRSDDGVNYNPSSLVGQISKADMGSAIQKGEAKKTEQERQPKPDAGSGKYFDISAYQSSSESISYTPTNAETAHIFDLMMTWVHNFLIDSSHDVILSATDTVLEILKADEGSLVEKQKEIAAFLEDVLDEQFNEVLNLSKRITDYSKQDDMDPEDDTEDQAIAVVFDEDEEEVEGEEQEDDNDNDNENEEGVGGENVDEDVTKEDGDVVVSTETIEDTTSLIPLHLIDEFFLQRKIASLLPEGDVEATVNSVFAALSNSDLPSRDLENDLVELFQYDHFDYIKILIENRWRIVFKIKYIKSPNEAIEEMELLKFTDLISELTGVKVASSRKRKLEDENEGSDLTMKRTKQKDAIRLPKIVDLDSLSFDQGSHLMTNTKIILPQGSYQQKKKLYDSITIPPPEKPPSMEDMDEKLVTIDSLPEWCQCVFPSSETSSLNRIQSKVFPLAFGNDDNLLLCAPTGAGKTNVAMLTVLKTIENYRNQESGKIKLHDFKIVYIAPLKALVQEQMREFQRRLTANFGIVVNELTGDSNLTKQQISETQVLVTTPEKWDVITRKATDSSAITKLTKLIIIDEIHLLHDERGPVLEGIISRTLRHSEPVRLVGLSATLPNYEDVAKFLRVDVKTNLYYFDSSYRPCPLEQQFIGIKEKKAIKKLNAMNEACYDKVVDCTEKNHQLIIFVHSRKDTYKTAKWISDKLRDEGKLDELILKNKDGTNNAVSRILSEESSNMKNQNLKEIIPNGFGIHHAGLDKLERLTVEDLFAQGHIQVLVSTATLAWGVNLPAHTVVIKGTETYSPEKGSWVQLSPQDILQMLGRAGRPRYDKSGEGVIITSHEDIQYYLAILNQQLPIESQLMSKLADNLNAEVVLGTVNSREEAITWLGYTYLYIRMLQLPGVYKVGADYKDDKTLYWKRQDLVHSAFTILAKNKLISYNELTGAVRPTDLGKIASHFYINYPTINMFNSQLKPWLTEIEILKIFANAGEFKYVPVRQEEKMELFKLMERCPIPIKENSNDPLAKVNVLLQSYISKLSLEGFALMADMIYITQSAGRLLRAIHEISLKKGWSSLTKITLNLCKMVEKRMWLSSSPFRQFGPDVPKEIIKSTESSHLPWMSYFTLTTAELSEAFNWKAGVSQRAFDLLQQFPKLSFSYRSQPITPTLLRVHLEILPEWEWNSHISGYFEPFLLLVEDCDGEKILHSDQFRVYRDHINEIHFIDFTVEIGEPMQPIYFVTLISEKWLHSEWKIPVVLEDLKLPKKFPPFTELSKLQTIPTSHLKHQEFIDLYAADDIKFFNKFQSQCFQQLYNSNDNVFVGISKGSGKTICGELSILNHWRQNKGRIVYISPVQEIVDHQYKSWRKRFNQLDDGERVINKLTGDLSKDIALLNSSHLTLATPEQFDLISRRWRQRKAIQSIELFIFDDIHMVGANALVGLIYESIISRMRFMSAQLSESSIRMIGLSSSLANGKDFGEWFGCATGNVFNFNPSERFNKIEEIRLQAPFSSTSNDVNSSILKSVYTYMQSLSIFAEDETSKAVIFLPSMQDCIKIGIELISKAIDESGEEVSGWLRVEESSIQPYLQKLVDPSLKNAILNGIAYYYKGMNPTDKLIVDKLYNGNYLPILLATRDTCYFAPTLNYAVILSTALYEGKEHRYVDYSINEILEMIGCCENNGKALVLTSQTKLTYYQKFLNEGLPTESFMDSILHDIFTTEVSTRTFKTRQDCIDMLTYTYLYRRLQKNPSFYGVKDTSYLGLSEYLSDLVESTLKDLEEAKIVEIEDDDDDEEDDDEEDEDEEELTPLDGAMIASYYNISYFTMKEFSQLSNKTKMKNILEILTNAYEFDSLPLRENEHKPLSKVYAKVPVKIGEPKYSSPHFKAFILLQAHFSRLPLPTIDLKLDQKFVLEKVLNILFGCIDTLSSEGHLNALNAMDISQMIVQACWDRDSPLKQIPYFDNKEIFDRCAKGKVETVYDIMSLEDDERDEILQLSGEKLEKVAEFVNLYPNVDLSYELDTSKTMFKDEPIEIQVNLQRDEDMDDLTVVAPLYPLTKNESWWVAIGDGKTKQLYGIKKTTILKEEQSLSLEFTIPNAGHHELSVWCMCDSYLYADKEVSFEIDVQE